MADEQTTATTTDDGDEDAATVTEPETATVTPEGYRAMQAALRKANKEAERSRLRLKDIEDRDKSEAQRALDRANEAERRAADAERSLLRAKVALAKNLPAELADRLHGDTEAEMEADAETLAGLVAARNTAAPTTVPTGARTAPDNGGDMNALLRRAAGRS